jgi:hypothetical protein
MEITKGRLREIISEELELSSKEDKELSRLMESYIEAYNDGVKVDTVPKEAVVDFLEVLDAERLPVEIFEAIVNNIPHKTIKKILKEVVEG